MEPAVTINIRKLSNLKTSRTPTWIIVRAEHGDSALKPSPKTEFIGGAGAELEVNHSVQLERGGGGSQAATEPSWIDRLVSLPLVFSLLEVAVQGKDKRGGGGAASKEEKTVTIGQGCADLLPLLQAAAAPRTSTAGSGLDGEERRATTMTLSVPITPAPAEASSAGKTGGAGTSGNVGCCTLEVELTCGGEGGSRACTIAEGGRVLATRVDALYAPPPQWTSSPAGVTYAAALQLPACNGDSPPQAAATMPPPSSTAFPTSVFPAGHYTSSTAAQGAKGQQRVPEPEHRAWNLPPAQPGGGPLVTSIVEPMRADGNDDDGLLGEPAHSYGVARDPVLRARARGGDRVAWFAEGRRYLAPRALDQFYTALRHQSLWPVEVARIQTPPPAPPTKNKRQSTSQDDSSAGAGGDVQLSFRGVAFVDLSPLLYPGCGRVRGLYRVFPYDEADVLRRTGRLPQLHAALQPQQQAGVGGAPAASDRLKNDAAAAPKKRAPSQTKVTAPGEASAKTGSGSGGSNAESAAFNEQKTFIRLEFCLDRPLIGRRPLPDIQQDITLLLPLPLADAGAKHGKQSAGEAEGCRDECIDGLHDSLQGIAAVVRDRLTGVVQNRLERQRAEERMMMSYARAPEKRRQPQGKGNLRLKDSFTDMLGDPALFRTHQEELMNVLVTSGVYDALQDRLRAAVQHVVQDKFSHMSAAQSRQERQELLPKVQMFVTREIEKCLVHWGRHQATGSLPEEVDATAPGEAPESHIYLLFAREAESEKHFKLAAHYYRRCVALGRTADNLFEHARFSLAAGDERAARRGLMAAVAQCPQHAPSLMLLAVLSALQGSTGQAVLFLEAAGEHEPDAVLPRAILGLVHDMAGDHVSRELAFRETRRRMRERQAASAAVDRPASRGDGNLLVRSSQDAASPANPTIGVTAASSATTVTARTTPGGDVAADALHASASRSSVSSVATALKGSQSSLAGGGSQVAFDDGGAAAAASKSLIQSQVSKPPLQAKGAAGAAAAVVEDEQVAEVPSPSIFMEAAEFALHCHAPHFAALALHHHVTAHGVSLDYHVAVARLCLERGQHAAGAESLRRALQHTYDCADVWALLGHVQYFAGEMALAKASYERCVKLPDAAADEHVVLLRLGHLCLLRDENADAKHLFLTAAHRHPSSAKAWLGVGKACYRLGALRDAEAALREARILNHEEAEVWAYLSLVALQCDRRLPAERTFQYALKMGLRDGALAREIAALQAIKGFGDPAKVLQIGAV